jgi:hypothetical protein
MRMKNAKEGRGMKEGQKEEGKVCQGPGPIGPRPTSGSRT